MQNWLYQDKSKIAFGFFRVGFEIEFDALERHCQFAMKALERELAEFNLEIDKVLVSKPEEYAEGYRESRSDEYWHLTEVLPRIQWYSLFLTAYSIFEKSLNELCNKVQSRSKFDLSLKDLSGHGITRTRNYLVKVAGVSSPFKEQDWQEATFFAEIRNAIAHKNGEIENRPTDQKSLSSRIKKRSDVRLKTQVEDQEDGQIDFEGIFVLNAIQVYRKIVMSICDYELYKD